MLPWHWKWAIWGHWSPDEYHVARGMMCDISSRSECEIWPMVAYLLWQRAHSVVQMLSSRGFGSSPGRNCKLNIDFRLVYEQTEPQYRLPR